MPRSVSHATTVQFEQPDRNRPALPTELRLRLLRLMLTARACDDAEATMKRRGQGHFQLSSKGHEAMAAVGLAVRDTDWIMPHYRDRALALARGLATEALFKDFLAKKDSLTGGRQMPYHITCRERRIVSVSSPVGTNFIQATGLAESLRDRKSDEVVVALSGDAATREGEMLEALLEASVEKLPVLFIVEDNGYGISTPTDGKTFWSVPNGLANRTNGSGYSLGCPVETVDALDPEALYAATTRALDKLRRNEGPHCIIAKLERLCSHSSSDDQRQYRGIDEMERILKLDPVKRYAEKLEKEGVLKADALALLNDEVNKEIEDALRVAQSSPEPDPSQERDGLFAPLPASLPKQETHRPASKSTKDGGLTLAQAMNHVLKQEFEQNPQLCMMGEDLEDPKGDVFGVTKGLSTQFGIRVRNSALAEATIMGSTIGKSLTGSPAIAAIQFVDFIGPALNQLLNEAATMYWRSKGEWNCPLVVLSPCGAYLPGLGPWHAQSSEGFFLHVPGLHVVVPSTPADAAGLLRYSLRSNRPVVYLYPKALLYTLEDAIEEPAAEHVIPFGVARTARLGRDATVVTWGNGVPLALKAAQTLAAEGTEAEVLDLRSLAPWDITAVLSSVKRTGRLLVLHEDNRTCGLGGEIVAEVCERALGSLLAAPRRITRADRHLPYHFALEQDALPQEDDILRAVRGMLSEQRTTVATAPIATPPIVATPVPPKLDPLQPATEKPAVPVDTSAATSASRRLAVVVPKQSPTDEEATVLRFHVKEGETVQEGATLLELEANKGSFEIESPHPGKVLELRAKEGDRVRIGSTVLYLEVAESVGIDDLGRPGESAMPAIKEIRLTPAQLQVGALAVKSQVEIPAVSVECEVDLTDLAKQREQMRAEFVQTWGLQVSYTHLILWAMAQALKEERNEGFRGRLDAKAERLIIAPNATIGLAIVGRNEDLYSPVLRCADQMSLRDIVRRVQELTKSIRQGQVNVADLYGASLTLTNIGPLKGIRGTPFVLPGQVAMVAVGALIRVPRYMDSREGEPKLEPRRVVNLKLVFDHRPFNGSHAMALLRSIRNHLEPMNLRDHLKK